MKTVWLAYQRPALLEEAQKFETYWSRMNSQNTDYPNTWLPLVKKCHDEIGGFRKQIKVSKGASSGVEEKRTKKKCGTSTSSSSIRSK